MKTISYSSQSRRPVAAFCAVLCGVAALTAADKKEPPLQNYVDFSAGYNLQEGDRAGFQKDGSRPRVADALTARPVSPQDSESLVPSRVKRS